MLACLLGDETAPSEHYFDPPKRRSAPHLYRLKACLSAPASHVSLKDRCGCGRRRPRRLPVLQAQEEGGQGEAQKLRTRPPAEPFRISVTPSIDELR